LKLDDLHTSIGRRVSYEKINALRSKNLCELRPSLGGIEPVPAAQNDPQVREKLRGKQCSDVHNPPGPVS
jgi:hypothetical protein